MSSPANIDAFAEKIAKEQNVIDPIIEHKYKTNKGDGYVGVMNAFDMRGKNKTLNLIVKAAPISENPREEIITKAFIREICLYEEIMPEFNKLQNEYNLKDKFECIPQCYATDNTVPHELLILDNVKAQGHDLWDCKKEMNFDHVDLVFRQYAKFHALSYALKEKHPEVFKGLATKMPDILIMFMTASVSMLQKTNRDLLTLFDPAEDKELVEMLGDFADNILEKYKAITEIDQHAVIVHGDCWCNNLMFKYNGDSKETPISLRLLDFQLTMVASPVIDLSYFFYTCASGEAIKNLPRFQKAYHESLTAHLKQFDLDAERIFSYSTFLDQWKKYSKYGLLMSSFMLKVMTSDRDEVPDYNEVKNEGESTWDALDFKSKNHEEYRRRMKNIIQHFYDNKFF